MTLEPVFGFENEYGFASGWQCCLAVEQQRTGERVAPLLTYGGGEGHLYDSRILGTIISPETRVLASHGNLRYSCPVSDKSGNVNVISTIEVTFGNHHRNLCPRCTMWRDNSRDPHAAETDFHDLHRKPRFLSGCETNRANARPIRAGPSGGIEEVRTKTRSAGGTGAARSDQQCTVRPTVCPDPRGLNRASRSYSRVAARELGMTIAVTGGFDLKQRLVSRFSFQEVVGRSSPADAERITYRGNPRQAFFPIVLKESGFSAYPYATVGCA